jgi:hypothetical protein
MGLSVAARAYLDLSEEADVCHRSMKLMEVRHMLCGGVISVENSLAHYMSVLLMTMITTTTTATMDIGLMCARD